MVLISLEGVEISYAVKLEFKATNNQAEYKALFIRLTLALALQAERVKIQTDSQPVANHFNESFQVKDEKNENYSKYSKQIVAKFKEVEVKQISKGENFRANILLRMGATSNAKMSELVLVEVKIFPSIWQEAKMVYLGAGKSWMDLIISYIRDKTLPIDK